MLSERFGYAIFGLEHDIQQVIGDAVVERRLDITEHPLVRLQVICPDALSGLDLLDGHEAILGPYRRTGLLTPVPASVRVFYRALMTPYLPSCLPWPLSPSR